MPNFDLNEIPVVEEVTHYDDLFRHPSNAPSATAQGIPGLSSWRNSPEFAAVDLSMVPERRAEMTSYGAPNWASELASVPAQCHRVPHKVIRPTARKWDQLGAYGVENMPSIFRPFAPALGRPPAVPAAIGVASIYSDLRQQWSQADAGFQKDVASHTTTESADEMEHNVGDSQGSETNGGTESSETDGRTLELSTWKIDHPSKVWEPTMTTALVSPALDGSTQSTQMALVKRQDLPLVGLNKNEGEASGFLGMTSKDPETGRWEAHIWVMADNVYLQVGSFDTYAEAFKFLSKYTGVKRIQNYYRALLPARMDCNGHPIEKGAEGVLQRSSRELIPYVRQGGSIYPQGVIKKRSNFSPSTRKSFPHATISNIISAPSFPNFSSATIDPSYRALEKIMQRLPCIRVKSWPNASRCCKNCRNAEKKAEKWMKNAGKNAAKWMNTVGRFLVAERGLRLQTYSPEAGPSNYISIPPAPAARLPAWLSRVAGKTTIGITGAAGPPVVMHTTGDGLVNFSGVIENERFNNLELNRAAGTQDCAFKMEELVSRSKESLMSIDSNLGQTLDSSTFFLTNPLPHLHSLP